MRILHFIQKKQLRGAEVFTCHLANELIKMGHDVKIVALLDGPSDMPFNDIVVLNAKTGLLFDIKTLKSIRDLIHEWKPDIIQANAGDTLRMTVLSKILFNWKTPIVLRNASVISKYLKSLIKRSYYRLLISRVNAVASVSHVSAHDFVTTFPFKKGQIHVISNGIDFNYLSNSKSNLSLPDNYVLHIGGFTFEKNHFDLIDIFEKMVLELPSIKLLLIGDGPLFPKVQEFVQQRNLTESVIFLGPLNDVGFYIKKAKALLLPSVIEGLPGVILEAMYYKIPVVAYRVGGIAQVLSSQTGWPIEPGNKTEFVDSVINIYKGIDKCEEKLCNAYCLVIEEYSIQMIAERFEELYEKICE